MTMLTCGWVVIIISFIVSMVNSDQCDNVLKGKSYWIWAKLTEEYNKYFVAASYQFDNNNDNPIRKFTYTHNEHTISFKIDKQNCDKFADAISNPPVDHHDIIRLQKITIIREYINKNNHALDFTKNVKFGTILIRPIQTDKDKDILWVGKDYDDIHYKIYKPIIEIMNTNDRWHLDEYSHQFVFTKIRRLDPQNGNYWNNIEEIKNHGGIVLFGDGDHKYGHSDKIAIYRQMESVHIMNLHRHYIHGKSKPFSIEEGKQNMTKTLADEEANALFKNNQKIVDVYSYLGVYDATIPEMQRTWTKVTNIKVPKKTDPKARDLTKYKDRKNNELYMFHTEHYNKKIADDINNKLKKLNEIEYVLIEYDEQRFKEQIKKTDYGKVDMMATAYAAFADHMSTKKLILADFPTYTTYFQGAFLLCREHDAMVNQEIYIHVWYAVRNAVMVNTINAVVHKHEQQSTTPTKLWITIGAQHGNPPNSAHQPIFLKDYSMEPMLLRPNNQFTISYKRDPEGKYIKWNMDARYFRQYFPRMSEDLSYFDSKYAGLQNNYIYHDDAEYDYDYHTKDGDVVGYNYHFDRTYGGLMLLLSIGMAIIVIFVFMYIYMLLCCICGAITGSCIYEQTKRNYIS